MDRRTSQNLKVYYEKGDIDLEVLYAIDEKDFYMTIKVIFLLLKLNL